METNKRYFKLSPLLEEQVIDYVLINDLLGESAAFRKAGERYLKKAFNEPDDLYNQRLNASVLTPDYTNHLQTVLGLMTSKKATLNEDVAPEIEKHLEDIDLQGNDVNTFIYYLLEDCLNYGMGLFLVDHPVIDDSITTLADYKKEDIRPYWTRISPTALINFKTETKYGRIKITEIELQEYAYDKLDYRGNVPIYHRVINAQSNTLYDDRGDIVEQTFTTLTELPLVVIYSKKRGTLQVTPPFKALADQCVAHYQVLSDITNKEHITNVPVLVLTGLKAPVASTAKNGKDVKQSNNIEIGTGKGLQLPEGATAQWLSPPTGSYNSSLDLLKKIEELIEKAKFVPDNEKAGAETAAAKRIDASSKIAFIKSLIARTQDAINQALIYHAEYLKMQAGTISLSTDVLETGLTIDEIKLLQADAVAGLISKETYIKILEENNMLPKDFDLEEEMALLDQSLLGPLDTNTGA